MSSQLLKIQSHEDISLILANNDYYLLYEQNDQMDTLMVNRDPFSIIYIRNPPKFIQLNAIKNCNSEHLLTIFKYINTSTSTDEETNLEIIKRCTSDNNIEIFKLMKQTDELKHAIIDVSFHNIDKLFEFIEDVSYDMVVKIFKKLYIVKRGWSGNINYLENYKKLIIFTKLKDEHKTDEIISNVLETINVSEVGKFYKYLNYNSDTMKQLIIENIKNYRYEKYNVFEIYYELYSTLNISDDDMLTKLFVDSIINKFSDDGIEKMLIKFNFNENIVLYLCDEYEGDPINLLCEYERNFNFSDNVTIHLIRKYKGPNYKLLNISNITSVNVQLKIIKRLSDLECLNLLMKINKLSDKIMFEIFSRCQTEKLIKDFCRICNIKKFQISHENKGYMIDGEYNIDLIKMILCIGNIEVETYLTYYGILGSGHFDKVIKPTDLFYMEIVKKNWYNLSYVPLNCRTKEIYDESIKQSYLAYIFK